jgi:hypothetical protein
MAFKEVYDSEILISETEIRPALYGCSLKEYGDNGVKERLWGEVCDGKDGNVGYYEETKNTVFQPQYAQCFTATTSLPHTYDYNLQYQNPPTVSNIPNKRTVNSPAVSDAISNQLSDF